MTPAERLTQPYPEGDPAAWPAFDQLRFRIDQLAEAVQSSPLQADWLTRSEAGRIRRALKRGKITQDGYDALRGYLAEVKAALPPIATCYT